jgi:hypothetical protein
MSKLRVDLQEGFTGDAVNVRVNGQEALRKDGVTTKRMLGLATSSEIEIPEGTVSIEIHVPTQKISKTISLHTSESRYLGVSIRGGELEHIASKKPFGYA